MTSSAGGYQIRPEAARSAVGNIGGVLAQALGVLQEVAQTLAPQTSFAQIGTGTAVQNTALHAQQVSSLQSLLKVVGQLKTLVSECVRAYEEADSLISRLFGADPTQQAGGSASSGLWATGASGAAALTGTATVPGTGAVQPVVDHLTQHGGWDTSTTPAPTFASPRQFADWLDASVDHQAQAGVVGVYTGPATGPDGTLGVTTHTGDVVIAEHGTTSAVGVQAADGRLYNHGVVSLDQATTVRVYRPISTTERF